MSPMSLHSVTIKHAGKKMGVLILLLLISTLPNATFAARLLPQQSHYYYDLGGGSDIAIPPVRRHTELRILGDIGSNLGYTCDGFNPAVSISNTLNNFRQSLYGLSDSIVGAATALMVGTAWYALEKANPDLYNLLQNAFASAGNTFNIGLKSCQDHRRLVQQGQSPYTEFITISDARGWLDSSRDAAKGQPKDPVIVRNTIAKQQGKQGMSWIHAGQLSGGINQPPIKVISDVTLAGYNTVVDPNRALDSTASVPNNEQTQALTRYWPTPTDAANWAALTVGDLTLTAESNNNTHANVGGMGLTPLLTMCPSVGHSERTCIATLRDKLWDVVNGNTNDTPENLRDMSASDLVITSDVIEAIRNQSLDARALSVNKLSEEVAIQNLVEEALALRRLLVIGAQAEPVQRTHTIQQHVNKSIERLDHDIQSIAFEHTIRKQMMGNTLQTVLSQQTHRSANAKAETHDQATLSLNQGAVYTKG